MIICFCPVNSVNTLGLSHNGYYRNKNLGTISSIEEADAFVQKHRISSSEFEDMYPGDEITILDGTYNKTWLVFGVNTEINRGETPLITPHFGLIPKVPLFTHSMNDSVSVTGGYANSNMHTTVLPEVVKNLQKVLGSHLLKHYVQLSNAVNPNNLSMAGNGYKGASSGWAWYEVYAVLPSEVQVYGTTVFSSSFYDVGEANQQLPLFKFINQVQFGRDFFWLRAVAHDGEFAQAVAHGNASAANANNTTISVRPLILIG